MCHSSNAARAEEYLIPLLASWTSVLLTRELPYKHIMPTALRGPQLST